LGTGNYLYYNYSLISIHIHKNCLCASKELLVNGNIIELMTLKK